MTRWVRLLLLPLALQAVQAFAAHEETGPLEVRSLIPVALVEAATTAAQDRFPDDPQQRRNFIVDYAEAYLDRCRLGERFRHLQKMRGEAERLPGFEAAKAAILDPKTRLTVTPSDFGYGLITTEGTYRGFFEVSKLQSETGEAFGICWGETDPPASGSKVRVRGYVSPKVLGGFGHMGAHSREIIVTSYTLVSSPEPKASSR